MNDSGQSKNDVTEEATPLQTAPGVLSIAPMRLLGVLLAVSVAVAGVFFAAVYRHGKDRPESSRAPGERQTAPVASPPRAPKPTKKPVQPNTGVAEPASKPPEPDVAPEETVKALEKEAIDVVDRMAKDFPRSSDPIGLMGMVHNMFGDTNEAMECWKKCVRQNPRRADVYEAMARVMLEKGEYQEAADLSRQALQRQPTSNEASYSLARALMGLGRAEEAVAVLEKRVQASPVESRFHCLLGKAYIELDEPEKARDSYRKAAELEPDLAEARYGLATTCARLGRTDQSRRHMEIFNKLKTKETKEHLRGRSVATDAAWAGRVVARVRTFAGRAYRADGYVLAAEEHWRRAATLDPENVACRKELASLYEQSGRNRDAVRVCEQLRKIDPKNAQYHLNAGVLYARMNRVDDALAAVEQAMKLEPDNRQYRRIYEQLQKKH